MMDNANEIITTESELAAIEARANAATPGPWQQGPTMNEWRLGHRTIVNEMGTLVGMRILGEANADFICEAHNSDIPRLIATIRALWAERVYPQTYGPLPSAPMDLAKEAYSDDDAE